MNPICKSELIVSGMKENGRQRNSNSRCSDSEVSKLRLKFREITESNGSQTSLPDNGYEGSLSDDVSSIGSQLTYDYSPTQSINSNYMSPYVNNSYGNYLQKPLEKRYYNQSSTDSQSSAPIAKVNRRTSMPPQKSFHEDQIPPIRARSNTCADQPNPSSIPHGQSLDSQNVKKSKKQKDKMKKSKSEWDVSKIKSNSMISNSSKKKEFKRQSRIDEDEVASILSEQTDSFSQNSLSLSIEQSKRR